MVILNETNGSPHIPTEQTTKQILFIGGKFNFLFNIFTYFCGRRKNNFLPSFRFSFKQIKNEVFTNVI